MSKFVSSWQKLRPVTLSIDININSWSYHRFKVFKSPYDDWRTDIPDPTYFKRRTPFINGTLHHLNFNNEVPDEDGPVLDPFITLGDRDFLASQTAVLAQGYFRAKHAGRYNFRSRGDNTDDWAYLWTGNKAFHDYTRANKDGEAFGFRSASQKDINVQLTLKKGQLVPITYLWVNYLGAGDSSFFVEDVSTGVSIYDLSGWFIWDCDDNAFT